MTTVTKVKGDVKIKSTDGHERPAKEGEKLKKGDVIATGKSSTAELKKEDGTVTHVGSRTAHTIGEKPKKSSNPSGGVGVEG